METISTASHLTDFGGITTLEKILSTGTFNDMNISVLLHFGKHVIRTFAWACLLLLAYPFAKLGWAFVSTQLRLGGNLSTTETQSHIHSFTSGCSRGGHEPRGIRRGFWQDFESWYEFELTDAELKCLGDKKQVAACACDLDQRRTPPPWFKSVGDTVTFLYGYGPSYACVFHEPGGKYWLTHAEGTHCLLKDSFKSDNHPRLKWLRVRAQAPPSVEAGKSFKLAFTYSNVGIVPVSVNLPTADGCRSRQWTSETCPFKFTNFECTAESRRSEQTIAPTTSFEFSLDAQISPGTSEGNYTCRLNALLEESGPHNWASFVETSDITIHVDGGTR